MYSSIYSLQSSTQRLPIRALFGFTLKLVESYSSLSSRGSLELKSKPIVLVLHTRSPSLIRKLYPDSRVKELHLRAFCFKHGQPLAPFPVAHLGFGSFSTVTLHTVHQPKVMPGVCRVAPVQVWFEATRRLSRSYPVVPASVRR